MPIIGVTGGIATGKTTVTEMFRELGARTLSADEIARAVLAPGTPGAAEVVERFGPKVITAQGDIDRQALGDVVFRDPEARKILNSITHPKIISTMENEIAEFRRNAEERDVLVVEIPLLVECNLFHLVDKVVVVAAEQETQMSRLTTRGLSADQARGRISAQMPISEKLPYADWVVTTDGSFAGTARQVERIWDAVVSPGSSL